MGKIEKNTVCDNAWDRISVKMRVEGWAALPRGVRGCLRFVIAVFPDHTHLLFSSKNREHSFFGKAYVRIRAKKERKTTFFVKFWLEKKA